MRKPHECCKHTILLLLRILTHTQQHKIQTMRQLCSKEKMLIIILKQLSVRRDIKAHAVAASALEELHVVHMEIEEKALQQTKLQVESCYSATVKYYLHWC